MKLRYRKWVSTVTLLKSCLYYLYSACLNVPTVLDCSINLELWGHFWIPHKHQSSGPKAVIMGRWSMEMGRAPDFGSKTQN